MSIIFDGGLSKNFTVLYLKTLCLKRSLRMLNAGVWIMLRNFIATFSCMFLVLVSQPTYADIDGKYREKLGGDVVLALEQYIKALRDHEQTKRAGDLGGMLRAISHVQQADERVKVAIKNSQAFSTLSDEHRTSCSQRLEKCEAAGHSMSCGGAITMCLIELHRDFRSNRDAKEYVPLRWKCGASGICSCDTISDCNEMAKSCCKDGKLSTTTPGSGACEVATLPVSDLCSEGGGKSPAEIISDFLEMLAP